MDNMYLIPANSKKSMLVFGLFTWKELILFLIGIAASLLLLMILPIQSLFMAILALAPGLIISFLVFPIPNYHNVKTIIGLAWEFYTTRQRFIWKGWCIQDGKTSKE